MHLRPGYRNGYENLADHVVDRSHLEGLKGEAAEIYREVESIPQAAARLERWRRRWQEVEPGAVAWLAEEFDLTLRYLTVPRQWQSRVKTTNPLERFIREVARQLDRRGICPSEASRERATYLTWLHIKHGGYAPTQRHPPPTEFTRTS